MESEQNQDFDQLLQTEMGESTESSPPPKRSRGRVYVVAALVMMAVICGAAFATKLGGTRGEGGESVQSKPDFVSLTAASTGPALCDPQIVQDTCYRLNNETLSYWNSAADQDPNVVHAKEISEALSVDIASVNALFSLLRSAHPNPLPNVATLQGADAVTCQSLCESMKNSIPAGQLAATSDVGCYFPSGSSTAQCDVDLSPTALNGIVMNMPSAMHASAFADNLTNQFPARYHETARAHAMNPTPPEEATLEHMAHRSMDARSLAKNLLNLFRVYPAISSHVSQNTAFNKFFGAVPREPQRRLSANWRDTTLRMAVTAKGYVATALRKMEGRQVGSIVTQWFGNNLEVTRTEIKRVLAGVQAMLDNVDYIYPGDKCQANIVAYVYPQSPWNKNAAGQYVFHLCDYYMTASDGYKIETLTHEGSHHLSMATADSPWTSGTMYGRAYCESVALQCKAGDQNACTAARENADSFCYFINDAALSAAGMAAAMPAAPVQPAGSSATQTVVEQAGGGGSFR